MGTVVVPNRTVLSLAVALVWVAAANAQPPSKNSVVGIWLVVENVKPPRPATLDLQADGTATWMTKDGIKDGSWTLEGNLVSVSLEKGNLVYDARMKGGKLVGTAQKDAAAWTWEAGREDAIVSATPARPAPVRPGLPEPGQAGRLLPAFVLQAPSFEAFAENYHFTTKLLGERPEAPFFPPFFPNPLESIVRDKPIVLYSAGDTFETFVLGVPVADEREFLKQFAPLNPQVKDGLHEMTMGERGLFVRLAGGNPRGYFGVQMAGTADPRGAVLDGVAKGGPADKAGLKKGDVLAAIDGRKIQTATDVRATVTPLPRGRAVDVRVIRDGAEQTIAVTVEGPPHVAERYAYLSASSKDDELARRALDPGRIPDAMDVLRLGEAADLALFFTPSYLAPDSRQRIGAKFAESIDDWRRRVKLAPDVPDAGRQAILATIDGVERWGKTIANDVTEVRLSLEIDREKRFVSWEAGVHGRRGSEFSTAVAELKGRDGLPTVAGAAATFRVSLPLPEGLQKLAAALEVGVQPKTPFERQLVSGIFDAFKWGECQFSLALFGPGDKGKAALLVGVKNAVANPGNRPPPLVIQKFEPPMNEAALNFFGEATMVATIRPGVSWVAVGDGAAGVLNKALLAPPGAGPIVDIDLSAGKFAEIVGSDAEKQALRNAFPNGGDRVRFVVAGGHALRARLTVPIDLFDVLRNTKAQKAP